MTGRISAEQAAFNVFLIFGTFLSLLLVAVALIPPVEVTALPLVGYIGGGIMATVYYVNHKDEHRKSGGV